MKTFMITAEVRRVMGYQVFQVEAKNEKEAREKFESGECDFVEEELEVVSLDNITIKIKEEDIPK